MHLLYSLELEKGKKSKAHGGSSGSTSMKTVEWPRMQRGGGVKKNNPLGFKKERRAVEGERWASLSLCRSLQLGYLLSSLWLYLGEGGKNFQRM